MGTSMESRVLGRSGIVTSALGLGCWAIGGEAFRGEQPLGYGAADDSESLAALHRALDLGVRLFDVADLYGCGHAERLLGEVLAERSAEPAVVVAKFGYRIDEARREVIGHLDLPRELDAALDASLARLRREAIDVYLLHLRDFDLTRIDDLIAALESRCDQGKIRGYGWSTDDPSRAAAIARGPRATAIELAYNALQGERSTLDAAVAKGLAALGRSPLLMGLLAGGAARGSDDVRSSLADSEALRRLAARRGELRAALEAGGGTAAQGALAWLHHEVPAIVPIPGFRDARQVEANVAALALPRLPATSLATLAALREDLALPPDPLALRNRA
jgi:aryl-alcohol dehydrogenase-like predicted oxidoreductase